MGLLRRTQNDTVTTRPWERLTMRLALEKLSHTFLVVGKIVERGIVPSRIVIQNHTRAN